MISEEQITERLAAQGQKGADIRATMREVGKLIIAKTAAAYLSSLPEQHQQAIRSLPEEDVEQYIAEHRAELPSMSQEEFDTIHDGTWEEYFREMSSRSSE